MNNDTQGNNVAWTQGYKLNPKCPAHGTRMCWKFASEEGCAKCFLNGVKDSSFPQEACERWEQTVRLLPGDIDELAEGDKCALCVGEPEEADGYAMFDMANPEPATMKGMIFGYGKKVRVPVGSLISLEVPIGRRCRRVLRMYEMMQVICMLAFTALAFVLLAIPAISTRMADLFILLPVIFLVLMVVGGWYLGRNLSLLYRKRHADEVNFDLSSIHVIHEMLDRGWFYFQSSHGMPHISFSKRRRHKSVSPPVPALRAGGEEPSGPATGAKGA